MPDCLHMMLCSINFSRNIAVDVAVTMATFINMSSLDISHSGINELPEDLHDCNQLRVRRDTSYI